MSFKVNGGQSHLKRKDYLYKLNKNIQIYYDDNLKIINHILYFSE